MTAEIVSVGTELLLGQIVDRNAATLGVLFAECGVIHRHRQTVGDNLDRLVEALRFALSRSDLVVTIGGLGPTQDDLTRDGIAAALDDDLVLDEAVVTHLKEVFARRGLAWVESNTRQAMRPRSGSIIPNPNGTAPGLVCRKAGKIVIALPGPVNEFDPMLETSVRSLLEALGGGQVLLSRTLRIAGMGESLVEARLGDLMESQNPTVAPYAKTAEVHLRLTARAVDRIGAIALLDPVEEAIRGRLGDAIYGVDDETLEYAVVTALQKHRATAAVAESCTGGLLGGRLTAVPGSSEVFLGGVIAYANAVKERMLGVPRSILDTDGAVSERCAAAMATGAREAFNSDYALSITGIAGPDGGSDAKPVGLVYLGIATPTGVTVHEQKFRGRRETIRDRAAQYALLLLRRALLERDRRS
ncbi:MAG TPA: competence/damage-inducible protein A [Fimbriimonadaceae bacterium]|nr:competence/damage-inducible protein A [Fimbriimonadaceae bacterium]